MTKLRAGIIGLGVGERHIAGYESHPDCEVVALCDFSAEKRAYLSAAYPAATIVAKADEILLNPDIDVVSIASYDNFHFEQVVQAIANDKHVFVEKPLCDHREQAVEIRRALNQKPSIKMSSNLILRRAPRFQWLKEKIDGGGMGRLSYVDADYNYGRVEKLTKGWRAAIEFYSMVYGGGVHMIDLMLWLTGRKIVEVAAVGTDIATQGSDFSNFDTVACVLRFEGGMVAKMTANGSCVYPHFHKFTVYGTEATFENGLAHGLWFDSRDPAVPPREIHEAYPGAEKGDFLRGFIDAIISDKKPEISRSEVFDAMSVCFAIEKSVHGGGLVPVDYI